MHSVPFTGPPDLVLALIPPHFDELTFVLASKHTHDANHTAKFVDITDIRSQQSIAGHPTMADPKIEQVTSTHSKLSLGPGVGLDVEATSTRISCVRLPTGSVNQVYYDSQSCSVLHIDLYIESVCYHSTILSCSKLVCA